MKRWIFGILVLVGIGWGIFLGFSLVMFAFTPASQSPLWQTPGESQANTVILEIHKGQTQAEIARLLVANHLVQYSGNSEDVKSFLLLGKLTRQWKKVKAGEYEFSPSMTPLKIFSVLSSGISIAHPLTVHEGENIYEIGTDVESKKLVSKAVFLELCHNKRFMQALGLTEPLPSSLEGYLYPDTYHFNKTMTAEDMVKQMVRHFLALWGTKEDQRAKELGFSRHELITLASMIEKETGAPGERPMIASVFHNRLKLKMQLQSDPTTIYGMWERYTGKIHKSDLQTPTNYNTYTIRALPIGPIANPGRESIQAALFPATSDFLFFVSHNDGTHEFTRTFAEHSKAVTKFQLDPKAREGKSWRDLKKAISHTQ